MPGVGELNADCTADVRTCSDATLGSMGMLLALLLTADPSVGSGVSPEAPSPARRFALAAGLGIDAQLQVGGLWIANVAAWADLEFTFRVLRWLRLGLISGAAWSPDNRPSYPGQHGLFRVMAGADALLALRWGEFFVGAAGGIQHTNLYYDDVWSAPPGYSTSWHPGPAFLVRAGAEFRTRELFSLGFTVAYGFFRALSVEQRHSVEVHGRISVGL